MLINQALQLLAKYSFSLHYKIQGASRDAGKDALVLSTQSLLAQSLVYFYLLLSVSRVSPALMNQPLLEPFTELLPWLENEMKILRIKPVNSTVRPDYSLLQESPYREFAGQHLENLEEHPWLLNAIQAVKALMIPVPAVSRQATIQQPRSSSSTLTPCLFITAFKIKPKSRPKWLSSVDNASNLAPGPSLLSLRPPETLLDLAIRLVEYSRGIKREIENTPVQANIEELIALRVESEIAYALLLEYCVQDFLNIEDSASTYLLYDLVIENFESLRRMGICRVFNEAVVHLPLNEGNDLALCQAALMSLRDMNLNAHEQCLQAADAGDLARATQFDRLAEVTDVIIDKLQRLLDDNTANYSAIAYFSL
jgi:hypothetical protein